MMATKPIVETAKHPNVLVIGDGQFANMSGTDKIRIWTVTIWAVIDYGYGE